MLKGNHIYGNPVITQDSGEQIGKIDDLIFDRNNRRIVAFKLAKNQGTHQTLDWNKAQAVGPDAVLVNSQETLGVFDEASHEVASLTRNLRVVTAEGHQLGTITDLLFDEKTGKFEGYEVSSGIVSTVYTGRYFIPASEVTTIGKDAIVVSAQAPELMENQASGIKSAAQKINEGFQVVSTTTREKLSGIAQMATEKLSGVRQTASEKLVEARQMANEKVNEARQIATDKASEARQAVNDRVQQASTIATDKLRGAQDTAAETVSKARQSVAVKVVETSEGAADRIENAGLKAADNISTQE
jgi:uncharacterized protein YrrD